MGKHLFIAEKPSVAKEFGKALKENMQQKVKSYNLKNVFFEGRQSDVAQYYKKASFICLTSNFEGWGMVLTEGMQYGCIPMTFNNYGAAYEIGGASQNFRS